MTEHVGIRIAALRRQRQMSQEELARALRRSPSWMSQVERGTQPVERVSMLQTIANALGVTVQVLRPEMASEPFDTEPIVNDLDAVRLSLSGHPALEQLLSTPGGGPADLESIRRSVSRVWDLAHASRFADLSTELAALLPVLEQATRTPGAETDLNTLHDLRARAYQAAAAAFARQGEPDAAWVSADRAMTAAEQAGEPLDVVAGHFRLAHAFMRLQRYDQAERVTTSAIVALRPQVESGEATPELLSLYGAMHLVRALMSARENDRRQAHQALAVADEVGRRLGVDRNDFDTEFGPTNVKIHRVTVAVDLGDAGEALEIARDIDPSSLSPERQARLYLDVARAHGLRRHVGDATEALLAAERAAPEYVRTHDLARSTVTDLLTTAAHRASEELRSLARRVDVNP